MAKFSKAEKQLLKRVSDGRLQTSLAAIRQAMENIWAADAPRIIQDYTDHGPLHCERLAGFAAKLLEANDGRPLSEKEMYLLLASIYLHDTGMQCDVLRFPEIKTRAEKLGAQFEVTFTAQKSSRYNLDEQKSIRKNHQYLSAAWIDHANRTGATVLGPAARTIPTELVDDLMDVCLHHTKLPITDCTLTFKRDPSQRKQLVAALLRFSDELDIDGSRVSIETVRNFNLDPRNSVYWWLHNCTKIVFGERSVIILTIWMHPDDVKQYGPFVHAGFITEFQSKNRPVLSVLAQNGIPIVISDDSKLAEDDRVEPLPVEIVQALQAMQKRRDPLIELANEVRTWLGAIRYEVSDPQRRDNRTADMLATLDLGTVKQRVLVRCIGGEITPADVDALDEVLDRKTPQGWLISDKRVSDRARERASADDAFQVFSLSDFLRRKVWGPYFDALTSLVEKDQIPDLYVDLGSYKQEMGEKGDEISRDKHASLDEYIDDWLKERGKMHISLLGDFGAGKTWFCRHYAYRQLERYLEDPANERLPLLITLRAFAKAMTAQQLINDALLEQYRLPFVGSAFEVFQEMNRRGKLLLILDGFDEMARQVDYQTVVDNFWELAKLVDESSKVILTSRTEYFRWAKESEKILGGEEFGRRILVLEPPKFEVLYLEPLSDEQIREVITRRLGVEQGSVVAERILGTPNLAEMARKPVLVELLLAALDEVSADVLENPAQVYLYATNKLLLRNITAEKTFTSTADKLYFLSELAWEMIKSGELRIHYTAIPERIKSYFGDRIKDQHELDTWDYDLRNQTLLHRDAAGYYEFAHKSLAEYFVAFKFAAELGCLAPSFAQTYCESDGQPCKIPIDQRDIAVLAETFGAITSTNRRIWGVHSFLQGLIMEDAAKRFWEIINETRGRTPDHVRYTGGNAVALLRMYWGKSFASANLEDTVLVGADLCGANLTGANFTSAILQEADLRSSTLVDTNFSGSDLSTADFGESYWIRAMSLDRNGKRALVGGGNSGSPRRSEGAAANFIALLDLRTGMQMYNLPIGLDDIWTVSLHPGGKYAAAGGDDEQVFILRIDTGEVVASWAGFRGRISCVQFSQNGRHLACGDGESVRVFRFSPSKPECLWSCTPLDVSSLAFSPDGKQLAVGDLSGPYIWLFNSSTGESVAKIRHRASTRHFLRDVCFDKSGEMLAYCDDRDIRIWHLSQHQELKVLCYAGNKRPVIGSMSIAFNPDGTKLASGGYDKTVRIWSVSTGEEILCLKGHKNYIYDLEWMPNGLSVASVSADSTIRIWDVDSSSSTFGQCMTVIRAKMDCRGMRVHRAYGVKDRLIEWDQEHEGTLLEFLTERGALVNSLASKVHTQRAGKCLSKRKRATKSHQKKSGSQR